MLLLPNQIICFIKCRYYTIQCDHENMARNNLTQTPSKYFWGNIELRNSGLTLRDEETFNMLTYYKNICFNHCIERVKLLNKR